MYYYNNNKPGKNTIFNTKIPIFATSYSLKPPFSRDVSQQHPKKPSQIYQIVPKCT